MFWVLPGDWDGGKERVEGSWKDGTWNVFGNGRGSTSQHCRHPRVRWVPAPITPEQQPHNHSEVSRERSKIKQSQRQQTSSKQDCSRQLKWDLGLLENWQEEMDVHISD